MQPKKFLTIIAGFILVSILTAVILLLVRDRLPQYRDENAPDAVVSNYLTAILREEYQTAYNTLGEWDQKPTYEEFVNRVRGLTGYQFCVEIYDYRGKEPGTENETSIFVETYRCDQDWQVDWETFEDFGKPNMGPNEAGLRRIDGIWKIERMPLPWWDTAWLPKNTDKE